VGGRSTNVSRKRLVSPKVDEPDGGGQPTAAEATRTSGRDWGPRLTATGLAAPAVLEFGIWGLRVEF
jgi:hypothetical protein